MNKILSIVWEEYLDTEEMWEKFKKKMQELIQECIPLKEFKGQKLQKNRTNSNLKMNKMLWEKK